MKNKKKDLKIWIITPSSYDDKGYLLQYQKILMRSGAGFLLKALAYQAAKDLSIKIQISIIEERLKNEQLYLKKIIKNNLYKKKLVFLTAKTFELPRAIDIALKLKKYGIKSIIGGPGVTLADWKIYKFLIKNKICFCVGEGEYIVPLAIKDFWKGSLKKAYWQKEFVDLSNTPLPSLSNKKDYENCINPLVPIGTSEGCPFGCSFCCVTTLRGRKIGEMRAKNPDLIVDWIKKSYDRGLKKFMLTDDNFRRSFYYNELKTKLISLNKKLNGELKFMIQSDISHGILDEIPSLAKMGVEQVFLGLESLDPVVLDSISKKHNKPEDYLKIARKFQKYGILTNAGVIVGFPPQTPTSIKKEIGQFRKILDLISIFCAAPFPGSKDYEEAIKNKTITTFDLNFYDTRHVCRDWFLHMTTKEAQKTFNKAILWSTSLKGSLTGRPWMLIKRNIKVMLFAKIMYYWGVLTRKTPYHWMMDGIPKKSSVKRPQKGFKGFTLTSEDLEKKLPYLEKITV